MARSSRPRRRGRATPERASLAGLAAELGFGDFSWPVLGRTALVLALGFGPLLVLALFDIDGVAEQALVALGPVLVCVAFAGLVLKYGTHYAREEGWSRAWVWLLVCLFLVLGALGGAGLFVSV